MGKTPDDVNDQTSKQLEDKVEGSRANLEGLVSEITRRGHELMDVKLQVRKHPRVFASIGAATVALVAGTVVFAIRGQRQKRSLRGRTHRLGQALSRALESPERVARSEPSVFGKIVAAAAAALVSTVARKVAERWTQSAVRAARAS